MAEWTWTQVNEHAAQLIAAGELSYTEIAEKVGVDRSTVARWAGNPDFQARVEEHLDDYRKLVRRRGIAILERRVDALNTRWAKLHQVIEERARDPELAKLAGGTTGTIVRDLKGIGKGEDFQVVETYSVDTGLMKAILDIEKQAAQELGQWTEKREVTGADGGALSVIIGFDERLAKVYGDGSDPVGSA